MRVKKSLLTKFIVAVDCEGCLRRGIARCLAQRIAQPRVCQAAGHPRVDAAARGLLAAGAEQVIDNHNGSLNLHYDLLDGCDIAPGVGFAHRFPGLDESWASPYWLSRHGQYRRCEYVPHL